MKKQCDCCGTCCRNGGPPLHVQDKELIQSGFLTFDDLVTIRRGELVLPPLATTPVAAQSEWIKIQGVRGGWCCRFLDTSTNSCAIYNNRPSSCRALKCWEPDEILAMAGSDLLSRFDLLDSDDPLLPLVHLQEESCPLPDMDNISAILSGDEESGRVQLLNKLTSLVKIDLQLRSRAVRELDISVARELFYFGRPLFQVLHPLGIVTVESLQGIELQYQSH